MQRLVLLFSLSFALPIFSAPVISEFMASNETTLADEDGEFSDWIEIFNPDAEPVDLGGYFLTDDALTLNRWVLPSTILPAGEWLVVFASGKDRDVGELHADFRLTAAGEYLALVAPDGVSVLSDFGANYPPQFEDQSYGVGSFGVGYFDAPTPGAVNSAGRIPGPQFGEVRTGGERPDLGENLIITASVTGAEDVTLFYRVGFDSEQAVAMASEDGENFSVTIPGAGDGALIRWRFVGQDVNGRVTREPSFQDPEDSQEYYGVPVLNPLVESNTEVMEWFISPQDFTRLDSFQVVRAGVYFLGEYYDNVRFSVRGQSTAFFDKKGYNMDFNRTQRFLWKKGERRVKDLDLLTNWADKSKSRNELAYGLMREAGVPTHFAKSIRLQQNGLFFSVADMVEDADDFYLERAGLNSEGALYKADKIALELSELSDAITPLTSRARKLTRDDEDYGDLSDFIRGINGAGEDRWDYIYDNVDLPSTINTLAGLTVIMQTDMFTKNYYVYRDTGGDDEWAILPWDLDLTFGRNFTESGGYFDQIIFAEGFTEFDESAKVVSLVNSLIDGNPATRAMFFRRVRTLSDRFLATDYLQGKTQEQLARLSPAEIFPSDAAQDLFQWGTWYHQDPTPRPFSSSHPDSETMTQAVTRLLTEWLPRRRTEIYQNTPDLPAAQADAAVMIGTLDFDPISDDQDQEFVELINQSPTAVDVSDWSVQGGITFTLPPGTVIPAGGSLFLSPDQTAFRRRDLSPTGSEQRFVTGPYSGNLSAEGETLDLYDESGLLRDSQTYSGSQVGFNGDSRADQDGDGLSAILEWALGTSDQLYNTVDAPVAGTLSYLVRSDLNGFTLRVETSPDLVTWERDGGAELARVPQNDGLDALTVQLPHSGARCFARLVLERSSP